LLGLGNIGSAVARIGKAFEMNLIAWSQNLTAEGADAGGAVLASKAAGCCKQSLIVGSVGRMLQTELNSRQCRQDAANRA
jgi:phosphoglycerate dehydrogenase-like enzyme